jgi:hypothetical protein
MARNHYGQLIDQTPDRITVSANRGKLVTDMADSFSRMSLCKPLSELDGSTKAYMTLLASQWMDNILGNFDKLNLDIPAEYKL